MQCWHCGTPMKEEGECPFCKVTNPRPPLWDFVHEFYIVVEGPYLAQVSNTPSRYSLPCDGRLLEREEYPELYEVLDNKFGGDETQFNLPDLRGER